MTDPTPDAAVRSRSRGQAWADHVDPVDAVVHDLLAPLAAIRGHLELLGEADLAIDLSTSVQVSARAAERMQEMVTGLLGGRVGAAAVVGDLDNAIKYGPDGGLVRVRLQEERSGGAATALLTVADDGPGIPQDELDRVFDARYRTSRALSGASGFGLGLSVSRAIVRECGGSLEASSAPGAGTVLSLRLPMLGARTA